MRELKPAAEFAAALSFIAVGLIFAIVVAIQIIDTWIAEDDLRAAWIEARK